MGKKEIGQILGGGLGGLIAQEPLAAISPLAGYLKHRKDKKADKAASRLASEKAEKDRMDQIMSGSTTPSSTAMMKQGGMTRTRPIDGKAVRGKTRGRKI
jgi:light-regulated signal transduction histidine kinase (bacteriophytochrome)|tara:strand:+ start:948 stop:1247 length:300 start_codon:yes stop_codon:yes gene_type:complete